MVSARAAQVPPAKVFRYIAADATWAAATDTGFIKMPDPKDDPKSSEWRPYIFARDQWHCRICGDRFLYSEMVRKHIANEHNETMPPSMYEYFHGAVWQRKNSHDLALSLKV